MAAVTIHGSGYAHFVGFAIVQTIQSYRRTMKYDPATPPEVALAVAVVQRRAVVFGWWYFPMLLAICGAVYAITALAVGQAAEIETGMGMTVLGLIMSGLGWLISAGLRFSKKPPKPAGYIPRVEQAIRSNPPVIIFCFIMAALSFLGGIAMIILLNFGRMAAVPVAISIAAFFLGVAYSMILNQRLLVAAMKVRVWQGPNPTR